MFAGIVLAQWIVCAVALDKPPVISLSLDEATACSCSGAVLSPKQRNNIVYKILWVFLGVEYIEMSTLTMIPDI